MAIAAGGAISLSAGMLLLEGSEIMRRSTNRVGLSEAASRVMELMLRHVREIEQDAGLAGLAQISVAAGSDLRFGAKGLRLNGTVLEMTIDTAATWHRAAVNVSALTFRYWRADGSEITSLPASSADREAIRQISIELTLAGKGESYRLRTRVYLRRFMNDAAA